MEICPALKYIEYKLFSRHKKGFGIHSPFVFNLVSETFRNKIEPDIVFNIESIRRKMILDPRIIEVDDLGTGSKRMKTRYRKVSDIARYSAVTKKYGIFLSNMARSFAGPMVLELGTSLGISTMYMAASCPDTTVYTIEGCPETAKIATGNFMEAGFSNIELLPGSFDEQLTGIAKKKVPPGLVYIDGNHRKGPVVDYFSTIANITGQDSVVIIDDIHNSAEMAEAWGEIKNHAKVALTIDIHRMGIVFFRKGLSHLHYVIRY